MSDSAARPLAACQDLCIDAVDPSRLSGFWAAALGLQSVPLEIDFVPVPEAKTVKNRIHLDVTTPDVGAVAAAGAAVLREPDGEVGWHVLADPDGNEFCAFPDAPEASGAS